MVEAMDLEAAAKLLGVSVHTTRAWARRGQLPHYKLGRRIVFDRADLEAYLKGHRVEPRNGGRER